MVRPKLNFLYAHSRRDVGSTFMRAQQLHVIAARHLADRLETRCIAMPEHNRLGLQLLWARMQKTGQMWFLTKLCVKLLTPEAIDILRRRFAGLCFNHVDTPISDMPCEGADLHISCSVAQQEEFVRLSQAGTLKGEPFLLLHNVDLAFDRKTAASQQQMRACYMGDPYNTDIPPDLTCRVDVLEATNRP